jgi:hypothetical protein
MKYFPLTTLIVSFLAILEGCAIKPTGLYYWGDYEEQIYKQYDNSAQASPAEQIAVLEKDIEVAKGHNMPVAPGVYAHLGHQYLATGNKDKALAYFNLEKHVYPESSAFMDRAINKLSTPP